MIRHNGLPIHLKWKGKPLFLCLLFDPSNPERISTQKSIHHCFIKKQIPYIHGKSRKRGVVKRGNIGQALEMVQNQTACTVWRRAVADESEPSAKK